MQFPKNNVQFWKTTKNEKIFLLMKVNITVFTVHVHVLQLILFQNQIFVADIILYRDIQRVFFRHFT